MDTQSPPQDEKNNVHAWASWGKFDASQFMRECNLKTFINPMTKIQHLNVKQFFARKFGHRIGLSRALGLRGLTFDGRQHSGIDDSKNLGRLLACETVLREAVLKRITSAKTQEE
ncbi:MAG: hypothetical protein EOO53_11800 [Gammaproteobacteria bacterium]|nr:MAG: hypothetical protein EOO53_11800 [Gammaproteobacteria bacterium]